MTVTTLEALRDAIRATPAKGQYMAPVNEAFARLVLGYTDTHVFLVSGWMGIPPGGDKFVNDVDFLDRLAGPGALFAAARERWPDCDISLGRSKRSPLFVKYEHWGAVETDPDESTQFCEHPLLCHALALAMVEAAIQERDNA